MRTTRFIFYIFPFALLVCACNSNKLEIKGDPQAIQLAREMIDSLGGKAKWAALKSVSVRTVNFVAGQNYVLEEWVDFNTPKLMNRKSTNNYSVIQILNGNDGWVIRNNNIQLMESETITQLLEWHDHYYMRAISLLASGGENCEVKLTGKDRFDLYKDNKFIGGFGLNEMKYPADYYEQPSDKNQASFTISQWGKYKGFTYPLEIHTHPGINEIKMDFWIPSPLDAEKAFNISFNPELELEKIK